MGNPGDNRVIDAAVLVFITLGLAVVLFPFWQPIFWAVVFGLVFWPLQRSWTRLLRGHANLSAALIVLLIVFVVLIPAFVIGGLIADGAALIASQAEAGFQSGIFSQGSLLGLLQEQFPNSFAAISSIGIDFAQVQQAIESAIVQAGQFVVANLVSIGQGASTFAFRLVLMLYLTFVVLCYGGQLYNVVYRAVPLPEHEKKTFATTFAVMAVGTLKGTLAVGLVQGTLGSVIFWLLGLDGAVFWGAVMGLLSIVPPFGAGFVWAPAAIILALQGDWTKGLILFAYGLLVISASDNIVRPIVVGRASSLPGYLVLLTTLGGLVSFGISGLVLGPVIAALCVAAWRMRSETPITDNAPH